MHFDPLRLLMKNVLAGTWNNLNLEDHGNQLLPMDIKINILARQSSTSAGAHAIRGRTGTPRPKTPGND